MVWCGVELVKWEYFQNQITWRTKKSKVLALFQHSLLAIEATPVVLSC
jgi:hypothetical protein